MKKVIGLVVGVAVLALVIVGVRYEMDRGSRWAQPSPEEAVVATTTPQTAATSTPATGDDAALQAEAALLLDQPATVDPSLNLSDSVQQMALQKIKDSTDMLRANYNYANPWYDLSAYRRMIGDYNGAIDDLLFVTKIRPDDFVSLHDLGDIYAFLKDYPKAESYYLASISKNPQNSDAYVALAAIYQYNDTANASQIVPLLQKGIAADPKDARLLITLGEYEKSIGNTAEAKTYLNKALALDPSNTSLQQEVAALGQ
ncbi:tetratricopeptide repeat protein [Patescibacteria group bacterium]|nr:tetratricopeptide repeat protein [Patescibacteria group bacterium]